MVCMHTICVHMLICKYQVLNFADIHAILENPAFHTKHISQYHLLLHVQNSGIATRLPSLFGLRSEHDLFPVQKPKNEEQNFGSLRLGQSTSFVSLPCLSHSKSLLARVRHREMLFYPEHILNSLSHHSVGHLCFVLYLTIYVEPYIKIPLCVSDLFL